jgi:4-amino-4-deoxychorismate lyase
MKLENACIETIWIRNHRVQNLGYHQARYEHTCKQYYGCAPSFKLSKCIDRNAIDSSDVKCRFIYDHQSYKVSYEVYQRSIIHSLQTIENKDISYPFKTLARPALDDLYGQRGKCDEIVITKNGNVTDAYYYSLVFENDKGFYVPKDALLPSTRRQALIDNNIVKEIRIHTSELKKYTHIHLINALNPLEKHRLTISCIRS